MKKYSFKSPRTDETLLAALELFQKASLYFYTSGIGEETVIAYEKMLREVFGATDNDIEKEIDLWKDVHRNVTMKISPHVYTPIHKRNLITRNSVFR